MGIALAWIGFALQLAGLGVALLGLRRTRQAYAPDMPGTFDWLVIPAHKASRRIVATYNRITRKSKNVTVHGAVALSQVSISGSVIATMTFGPYDPTLPVEEQLRILDARLRADHDTLNRLELDSASFRGDLTATGKRIDGVQVELRDHVQASVRTLAVGGIRGAIWGLLLTLVGTVVADLPTLIPALGG
ncbi:hypothetical protein [Humibacter sp.]|uniref:hypothetical protein n=1 Tax=Humibacter sp. TaxID=1940291 RepID=UPI003F7E3CB4